MIINLTSKPLRRWSYKQVSALDDSIMMDYPFPIKEAHEFSDNASVNKAAEEIVQNIILAHPKAVVCKANSVLMFSVIYLLLKNNIKVLDICTKTSVRSLKLGNVTQTSNYAVFVGFKEYTLP